ncbi:hypothetical protein ACP70R_015128 [Stipagrostis hirtigluma subsp. patula]
MFACLLSEQFVFWLIRNKSLGAVSTVEGPRAGSSSASQT